MDSFVFMVWHCAWIAWSLLAGAGQTTPLSVPQLSGKRTQPPSPWAIHTLRATEYWQLDAPRGERFDASALLQTTAGDLLTVNDRGFPLCRIVFRSERRAAELVPAPSLFADAQATTWAPETRGRYDSEGLAQDEQGRIYLCEEAHRWVLRWDPVSNKTERLPIDWSPVTRFFSVMDPNASFEGVAAGRGFLYVANERQLGRIIVVDLSTMKVTDSFVVRPHGSQARDLHYSDLSWFDDALFVLLRESHVVLKVSPATKKVLAQYDFRGLEEAPEVLYRNRYPTGVMEGLAVTGDTIWLLTDNNGLARARHPGDARPTLFRCPRPEAR